MQFKTKVRYTAALVAGALSMTAIPVVNAASVSIVNPGFEDSFSSWEDKDPSSISSDERSGSKAAKITGDGGKFEQDVKVEANTSYELTAYIEGTGKIGATVDGTRYTRTGGGDDEYEKVTVSFNSGSSTSITIFGNYYGAEARFDDFALESVGSTDPVVTTDPDDTTDTGVTIAPGDAEYPSDLMRNYNQWKITYPDGVEDKTLLKATNEYFYVNDTGNGIVFKAPVRSNNGTTPNSDYIRSELRERTEDGKSDIYWTTTGTHVVYSKQAITHLPLVKDHLVATQIHGNKDDGIDDSMVLRLEGTHLFLSFNGGKLRSDLTIKEDYKLGTIQEVIFEVVNDKHYVYYSEDGGLNAAYAAGNASKYLVKDGSSSYVMNYNYDQAYFKIGNYTQTNADEEGSETDDSDNYGEVVVYDFWVDHE